MEARPTIAWDFTRDAEKEIDRLGRLAPGGKDSPVHIIPVRVDQLITEDFKLELLLLRES